MTAAVVQTALGRLEGEAQAGRLVFRGVPYAAPPIGELRFRAPAPPVGWNGVRDARRSGPTSPQVFGMMRDLEPQDEDCLHLNIWTGGLKGQARPVLVFIHGGGFISGASTHAMYDCRELSRRGDVVVVSFNYRLGALGFADVGALDERFSADANCGLLDQFAALRWVRDHIANFGGDPEQVTVFGHSAGAMSACTLLTLPPSARLMRRVIAQSGAGHHVHARSESARIAEKLVEALALVPSELHRLRELPYAAITKAQLACLRQWSTVGAAGRPLLNANMTLLPVVDGALIVEAPIDAARRGAGSDIPLLLGTTRDEWNFFAFLAEADKRDIDQAALPHVVQKRLPGLAETAIDLYQRVLAPDRRAQPWQILSAIETDRIFRMPALRLAQARHGASTPTFVYDFDWNGPLFEGGMGSCHTMDVPFVLGVVDEGFGKVFTGGGAEARELSDRVMDSWLAFARGADPSTEALGTWPRYQGERSAVMHLAPRSSLGSPHAPELDAFWDALV